MNKQAFLVSLVVATLPMAGCTYNINSQKSLNHATAPEAASRSDLHVSLKADSAFDGEAAVRGIICSAHKYRMNLSEDLSGMLADIDQDGSLTQPAHPDVTVFAAMSSSTLKCISTGAASGKCEARVNVSGKIVARNGKSAPFNISKTSVIPTALCEGAARSLKEASAEALGGIVDKVRRYGQ